ncbi:hypothetical protein AB0D27_11375 [Streptomyces sp. NPDC048415]|uniref:hypothetical protein n=1 Tax=Streptomyces sp. NPDC048415 TaxID=3154822 RepID=UPI00341357D2
MSDEISQAVREALEAGDNSRRLELITAVLQAQQLTQQQPCQHQAPAPRRDFNYGKWFAIGGVASVIAVCVALAAVAIAVAIACATVCLLIVWSVWRDVKKRI